MGAEEDATARRERLKALRAAKELLSAPDAAPAAEQQYGLPFLSLPTPLCC
jgi:coiled-coil domain-containing protein 12